MSDHPPTDPPENRDEKDDEPRLLILPAEEPHPSLVRRLIQRIRGASDSADQDLPGGSFLDDPLDAGDREMVPDPDHDDPGPNVSGDELAPEPDGADPALDVGGDDPSADAVGDETGPDVDASDPVSDTIEGEATQDAPPKGPGSAGASEEAPPWVQEVLKDSSVVGEPSEAEVEPIPGDPAGDEELPTDEERTATDRLPSPEELEESWEIRMQQELRARKESGSRADLLRRMKRRAKSEVTRLAEPEPIPVGSSPRLEDRPAIVEDQDPHVEELEPPLRAAGPGSQIDSALDKVDQLARSEDHATRRRESSRTRRDAPPSRSPPPSRKKRSGRPKKGATEKSDDTPPLLFGPSTSEKPRRKGERPRRGRRAPVEGPSSPPDPGNHWIDTREPPVQRSTLKMLPGRLEPMDKEVIQQEVRFLSGPGPVQEVTLGWDLGDPPRHVMLDHPSIQPRHAKMTYWDGRWWIETLSEFYPVEVNGIPLHLSERPVALEDGDLVRLGEAVFRFHIS